MNVRVLLFAAARDLAGDSIDLELPSGSLVRDLRRELIVKAPQLAPLVAFSRFAINSQYAADDSPVPPTADIACIPPVSGG